MPEETPTQIVSATITPTAQAVNDIAALRDKVAALVPGLIPEMLKGDSVSALMQSIDESKAIFDRYFTTPVTPPVTTETTTATVTTTTPPETPPVTPPGGGAYTQDLSKLPAHELIKQGLAQRRS